MESFVFRMKFRYKFLIAFLLSWTFALIRVGTSLDAELDEQMINSITNQSECHIDAPCSMLSANCFKCNFNYSCIYGAEVSSKCTPNADAKCTVSLVVQLKFANLGDRYRVIGNLRKLTSVRFATNCLPNCTIVLRKLPVNSTLVTRPPVWPMMMWFVLGSGNLKNFFDANLFPATNGLRP